jgi:integrase
MPTKVRRSSECHSVLIGPQTRLYQLNLDTLKATRNIPAGVPATDHPVQPQLTSSTPEQTDATVRNERASRPLRVRPTRNVPTFGAARRRTCNIDRARKILSESEGHEIMTGLAGDNRGYGQAVVPEQIMTGFFDDPLPIVTDCVIPTGTKSFPLTEDKRMNELDTRLVDAIDAGTSELGRLSPQVAYFLRNSRAPSTRALYRWAWSRALQTCRELDRCAIPMSEETAALIIVEGVNEGLAVGSLRIISSVISVAHAVAKQPDPTRTEAFRSVMRGIGRALTHQIDQKVALDVDELLVIRRACDADPNPARGKRDWALVSYGFAGAFRRSEIVARNHADHEFIGDDLRVYLDRSKTDQYGRGAYVTIKPAKDPQLCPIRALHDWIAIAPGPGPVFRPISSHGGVLYRRLSAYSVSMIVKGFGVVLNLPEDRLGAHSLRAGMVTALLESGIGDIITMEHSRHKAHDSLQRYYRPRRATVNFTQLAGC